MSRAAASSSMTLSRPKAPGVWPGARMARWAPVLVKTVCSSTLQFGHL